MAVRASQEIVIDAPPRDILDALADIDAVPTWSRVHKRAEVIDRYDDGRPHHVRVAVKVLGLIDEEVLEYHWGPDWLVWDAGRTNQQHGQHVEYNLKPEGDKTRVRIDITVEPGGPIPDFLVKRASKTVLHSATVGLRERVMRDKQAI